VYDLYDYLTLLHDVRPLDTRLRVHASPYTTRLTDAYDKRYFTRGVPTYYTT